MSRLLLSNWIKKKKYYDGMLKWPLLNNKIKKIN